MTSIPTPRLVTAPGTTLVFLLLLLPNPLRAQSDAAVSPLALPHSVQQMIRAGSPPIPSADSSGVGPVAPASSSLWLPASREGALWRADRLQHAGASATLVVGAGALGAGELEAAAAAAAFGVLKEIGDAAAGGGMSRLDLAADVIGIGLGLVLLGLTR